MTAGSTPRAAGRGRGDDHTHRGVDLLYGERAGEHISKQSSGERAGWTVRELCSASPPTKPEADFRSPTSPRSTAPFITVSARCRTSRISADGTTLIVALHFEREL
jgi:hypothetical protein